MNVSVRASQILKVMEKVKDLKSRTDGAYRAISHVIVLNKLKLRKSKTPSSRRLSFLVTDIFLYIYIYKIYAFCVCSLYIYCHRQPEKELKVKEIPGEIIRIFTAYPPRRKVCYTYC